MNTFYGVGTGPGDPRLLTLRALEVLRAAPVLAVPRTKGEHTLALDIVRGALDTEGKELLFLDFPMTRDEVKRKAAQERGLALLLEALRTRGDVAMLTLGDASTYSNLAYFLEGIRSRGYAAQIIPGVPSYCAGAAALGLSLTERDLPLHILPAGAGDLQAQLALPGSKVLMKPTLPLARLKAMLRERGVLETVRYVEYATLPGEKAGRLADREEELNYFTTLFVPGEPKDERR